ncbi:MAG: hypothetical protein ABIO81_09635 [Ginsengibacter sp.]
MRNFLLFLCLVFFTANNIAQVPVAMPPEADAFYNKAMPVIKPQLKNVIVKAASSLKNRQANADSIFKSLHSNPVLKNMNDENIQGITTLIMIQASKDSDEDLKKMVLSMRNNNEAAQVLNTDSDDKKQLILRKIMHRKSKMAEEISLIIKDVSENSETIINNLK